MAEEFYRLFEHGERYFDARWSIEQGEDSLGCVTRLDRRMDPENVSRAVLTILDRLASVAQTSELCLSAGPGETRAVCPLPPRVAHDRTGFALLIESLEVSGAIAAEAELRVALSRSRVVVDEADVTALLLLRDVAQEITAVGTPSRAPIGTIAARLGAGDGSGHPTNAKAWDVEGLSQSHAHLQAETEAQERPWTDIDFDWPASFEAQPATPARARPPLVAKGMEAGSAIDSRVGTSVRHESAKVEGLLRPLPPVYAYRVSAQDPRLAPLLWPFPDLRELVAEARPSEWPDVHDLIIEIQALLEEHSAITLEEEAEAILRVLISPKDVHRLPALAGRFGLVGDRVQTLDEIGKKLALTRERARQLLGKIALPSSPVGAPAALGVVELLSHVLPCKPDELVDALREAGLTKRAGWSAETLREVLAISGHRVPLEERAGLIGVEGSIEGVEAVLAAAKAVSCKHGVGTVEDVILRLRDREREVPQRLVDHVLRSSETVHWVGDRAFWTDHSPGRNRLENTCLRILTLISPQVSADIWEGVDRNFRWRSATGSTGELRTPSIEELREFLSSHPAFRALENDRFEAAIRPDPAILGAEKRAVAEILLGAPNGMMDRNQFLRACSLAGIKTSTAGVFLTYGEIFKNYGHNVWGLRGLTASHDEVRRMQKDAREGLKLEDRRKVSGVTGSGRPWVAFKVTSTVLFSGVIQANWFLSHGSIGDILDVIDIMDGAKVGSVKFSGPFNYGYSTLIRKHDLRIGDVVRILAQPADGICYAECGGDDLLEEPFDF